MAYFTLNKFLFGGVYNVFHKTILFTPLIKASKATCLINSLNLSISSLNLFKYARMDSPLVWKTPKSFVELF